MSEQVPQGPQELDQRSYEDAVTQGDSGLVGSDIFPEVETHPVRSKAYRLSRLGLSENIRVIRDED